MAFGREILASLAIRLGIDTSEMGTGVAKAKANISGLEKSVKGLGIALGATFAAGGVLIASWAKQGYETYRRQLKQEELLLTALRGRHDIQERLIRQASYLQKTTLFEDDAIIQQQQFLASTGRSEKQIRSIISAATDLATAFGIELDRAVKLLTGSYSGNLRELGRYIPELKNLTREQLAAGEAVNWVNENLKGLAKTAADTDPVTQLTKSWKEFKELFGKGVAPAINAVLSRLNETLQVVQSTNLSVWEKLGMFAPGLAGSLQKTKNILKVQSIDAEQQAMDEASASTETFASSIEELDKTLKSADIQRNLEAMAASVEKYSRAAMSVPDFWPKQPIQQITNKRSIGFVNSAAQQNDPFMSFRSMQELTVERNRENLLQMAQDTKEFAKMIETTLEDLVITFADSFGQMIVKGKNANWNQLLVPVADAMSKLGQLIIVSAIALDALKKSLVNWAKTNKAAAIAAGVALIATAAAIKAGIANIATGGSSNAASIQSMDRREDYTMNRNLGDIEPIRVIVEGEIAGEVIRIANKRAEEKHINRY